MATTRTRARTAGGRPLAAVPLLVLLAVTGCSSHQAAGGPAVTTSAPQPSATAPATASVGATGLTAVPYPQWFWSKKLPDDAPLAATSSVLAADLAAQVAETKQKYGYDVSLNTYQYAPPVFQAGPSEATVRIKPDNCQNKSDKTMQAWSDTLGDVPIPAQAQPSAGSDHQVVVWQPSTDTVWELWTASKAADGSWSACWGGKMTDASRSNGVFPFPYGTSASGLSELGGLVTPAEVQAGLIPHALAMNIPSAAAGPVGQANRSDGHGAVGTQLAEGSHLRLPPDYPVTGTKVEQTFIAALKDYGAVVSDKAGAVVFEGENVKAETGTDPWAAVLGQPAYTLFNGIDWSKVQVLDPSFDGPGPSSSPTATKKATKKASGSPSATS